MSKATQDKVRSLKQQAGGYLTLAMGHCRARNADQARMYLEKAKSLLRASESFVDPDATREYEMVLTERKAA